jgi:hypothetical protein
MPRVMRASGAIDRIDSAPMTTGRLGRTVEPSLAKMAIIASASTRAGKASSTSMIAEITRSTRPRKNPATMPTRPPDTKPRMTTEKAMNSEVRPPFTTWENRSSPLLLTPNQWLAEGPSAGGTEKSGNVPGSSTKGRYGASSVSPRTATSHTVLSQKPTPRRRFRDRPSSAGASPLAGAGAAPAVSARPTGSSFRWSGSTSDTADPRVECGVHQVDEEVDDHEAGGDDGDHALHDEDVAAGRWRRRASCPSPACRRWSR